MTMQIDGAEKQLQQFIGPQACVECDALLQSVVS